MVRKTYRSLDKPSAFFGIRGRFKLVLGAFAVAAIFPAVVAGGSFGSTGGFIVFGLCFAGAYFYVMALQARSSDREFFKRLASRRYPRFIRVPARRLSSLWRGCGPLTFK